jgi:Relaxase/Mobilisation nuclease domain
MIIKGSSRSGPAALATHLGNAEKNERVSLLETRGTVAQDLRGALVEMDAYALGTRCEKPLYHAAMSPEPPHRLTDEQRTEAIDALEKKLGLDGHSRVVVMHEKLGREHIHVVWSRIDLDHMRSVSDSHNYRKHEEVARDLERRFGHDRVQGAHAERDGVERPDRTPSRAELRQEERTGIKGKDVKLDVTEAFRASDGPEAFRTALDDKGYLLAKGDKRDFVIVDRAGGIHSLARRIDGMKAAELREFMKPLDRESLPSAERAKETQLDRGRGLQSAYDQQRWDEALAASGIEKARQLEDLQKRQRQELREAHADATHEKAYGRGDDYVSQTMAAQKDHARRQGEVPNEPRPQHPSDHRPPSVENDFGRESRTTTELAQTHGSQITSLHQGEWIGPDQRLGEIRQGFDYNKAATSRYERMDRLIYGEDGYAHSEQWQQAAVRAREDREKREARIQQADPLDRPIGPNRDAINYVEIGEKKYKGMRELLRREDSDEVRIATILSADESQKRSARQSESEKRSSDRSDNNSRRDSVEVTDRMRRLLDGAKDEERDLEHDDDLDPDRQREAPGGGRTRSR